MKKTQLRIIKCKTLELRSKKQIPLFLAKLINDLTGKEESKYIQTLLEFSEHMLRVQWYYKKYPEEDKQCEEIIKEALAKLGF